MAVREAVKTPDGIVKRVVFDLDFMMLCDGFQYAHINNSGREQLVRRLCHEHEHEGVWSIVPDLGSVEDISKEGLLEICMSFARIIHGENLLDEECREMIIKEWGLLRSSQEAN